jgi:acetyl-CoA carboxylase biotin carboxyl carrier protein
MSETRITQKDFDDILRLVESAEHVTEFHIKYGDLELHVSRNTGAASATPVPAPVARAAAETAGDAAAAPARAAAPQAGAEARRFDGMLVVKAPMVGTFYRAPAPGAKPFVEVGQRVHADSVVCIIEVMKLMNTIHAGAEATVREVLVGDAQLVQFDQPLIVLEPARR